jgi:hypothetical protein
MVKKSRKFGLTKTIILFVTLLLFTGLGCAIPIGENSDQRTPNNQTPGNSFAYLIRVQEESTNRNIPNAKVTIEVTGQTPLDARTDTNGLARIFIDVLYAGKPGRLLVESNGYVSYRQEIDLTQGALPGILLLSSSIATDEPIPMKIVPTDTPAQESIAASESISTNTPQPTPTNTPILEPTHTPTPESIPTDTSISVASSDINWHGEYFDNDEFLPPVAYEREDPVITFNWEEANPVPGVGFDYFSTRWTRCLDFEERYYTFTGKTNDFMEAWIDDTNLFRGNGSLSQKLYVTAGNHCLKVEFKESNYSASVSFDFKAE